MTAKMTANPFRLDGQVALITGAGTGLGLGMARCFLAAGARVVITGRREAVLREAAAELGEGACYEVLDVTDTAAATQVVDRVQQRVGPITCLINNAGIHLKKPALQTQDHEFEAVLRTHLTGSLALTRAVAPGMIQRRQGAILFIASMTTFLAIPQVVAYATAKSGVAGLVRTLAAELSPHGLRVNAIAPGWIESPMLQQALAGDEQRKNKILSRTLMGRFGQPHDIGHAAVYLASDAASFITGVILPVDGGASVGF